jgi:hypothetical protein
VTNLTERICGWFRRRPPQSPLLPTCAGCGRSFEDGDLVDVNDTAGDGSAFCHNGECICLYVWKQPAPKMVIANTRTFRAGEKR